MVVSSDKERDAAGEGIAQTQRVCSVMDEVASDEWQGVFHTSGVTSSWQHARWILRVNEGNQRTEGAGARRKPVTGVRSSRVGWQQGQPRSSDGAEVRVPH